VDTALGGRFVAGEDAGADLAAKNRTRLGILGLIRMIEGSIIPQTEDDTMCNMKAGQWVCAIVCSLVLSGGRCGADDTTTVASEYVSLGEGDFRLVAEPGKGLVLQHEHGELTQSCIVVPKFVGAEPNAAAKTVTEVALARWNRTSLIALVEMSDGDDATYVCLTFADVDIGGAETMREPTAAIMMHGKRQDKILALSGDRMGPSIVAVIGRLSTTLPGGALDSGQIVFHGCPNPAAVGGRVGSFVPQYVPLEFDR